MNEKAKKIFAITAMAAMLAISPAANAKDASSGGSPFMSATPSTGHSIKSVSTRTNPNVGSQGLLVDRTETFADGIENLKSVSWDGSNIAIPTVKIGDTATQIVSTTDGSIEIMAPGHKNAVATYPEANAENVVKAQIQRATDYIDFIQEYSNKNSNNGLVADAWTKYVKVTFGPLVDDGLMSPTELNEMRNQFIAAQNWLDKNPKDADDDSSSLSAKELSSVMDKTDIWKKK